MSQSFTDDCFASGHVAQTDMQNIENNFAALKSTFSGSSAPSNLVAGMWWYDTGNNILKIRNEANDDWQSVWDFGNNKPVIANLSGDITGTMIASAIKDAAAATASLRTLGTGALQACAGNDSRITAPTSGTSYKIYTLWDEVASCTRDTGDGGYVATSLHRWTDPSYHYGCIVTKAGVITAYFQDCLTVSVGGHVKYARVLKNGSSQATWSTTSASYQVRTANISVSVGDQIIFQHYVTYDSNPGKIRYQRIYSGVSVGAIGA